MSEFGVYCGRLNNHAMRLKDISKILENQSQKIDTIKDEIHISSRTETIIKRQLSGIATELLEKKNNVQAMGEKLGEISQKYQNCEKEISNTSGISAKKDREASYGSNNQKINSDKKTPWYEKSGAIKGWSIAGAGSIFGVNTSGSADGEVLGYSFSRKTASGVNWKEDEETGKKKLDSISLIDAEASAEGHAAKGSLKGNIGIVSGSATGTAGSLAGQGKITASLYKDGKLSPQLGVEGSASAKGLDGKANITVGNEEYNVHADAKGTLGSAEAKGGFAVGKVNYKKSDETEVSGWGVKGSAKAEAYLAEGSVSGGVNILGIKIDVSLGGKAGGAGIGVEGGFSTGGVGGSVSAGVGVGAEIGINIDWSGFKNPFKKILLWKK
mgnify:CR=1 FL=1